MGLVIAKTIISTIDTLICGCVLYGVHGDRTKKIIGIGAVIFTALNIAAMWL